jgi:hypothetical protein
LLKESETHPCGLSAPVVVFRSNRTTVPGVDATTYSDVPSRLIAAMYGLVNPRAVCAQPSGLLPRSAMQPRRRRTPVFGSRWNRTIASSPCPMTYTDVPSRLATTDVAPSSPGAVRPHPAGLLAGSAIHPFGVSAPVAAEAPAGRQSASRPAAASAKSARRPVRRTSRADKTGER